MDKTQEALKLALEALKQIDEAMPFPVAKFAQSAIREALAEQSAHESAYQRGYMDGIAKGLRMEQPAPRHRSQAAGEEHMTAADYCKQCNAPHAPAIKVVSRCGPCVVLNGKLPPTKYVEKSKEAK